MKPIVEPLSYARVRKLMYPVIDRIVRDKCATEELVNDTYLKMLRNIHAFDGKCQLSSWVYRIAVNEALMYLRKIRTEKRIVVPIGPEEFPAPVSRVADFHLRKKLKTMILRLPSDYLAAWWLRDVEQLTNEDVALVLKSTVPAVKSRVNRSRYFLRDKLREEYKESTGREYSGNLAWARQIPQGSRRRVREVKMNKVANRD